MEDKRHSATLHLSAGRFHVFLYAREFRFLHSWQLGLSLDRVMGLDNYLDFEVKALCFGLGVRFVWIRRVR